MIQINSIYHDIQLSFGTSDVKRTTIKQNSEDTHVLRIKLYDKQNNEITIDSNWNINISAIKGDKTHILNTNNISIKDNTIHVTMTKQMLSASGTEHCELIIQDRDQTLFSDTFLIYVEPNVQDGSFIESSNECDSIIDTLQHVEEKKDMVDQLTSEIEETKVDIGKTYDELKIAVEETNGLIQENQIIKSNEAERQNNEGIRQSQEADRQTNTATAIANAEAATERANNATDDLQNKLDSHHFVLTEDKDIAGGVPSLDVNAKVPINELYEATTTSKGITQLTDSVTSDSTTTAATPNSVKSVKDSLNSEITRAKSAEKANADAISTETSRATTKENEITNNLSVLETNLGDLKKEEVDNKIESEVATDFSQADTPQFQQTIDDVFEEVNELKGDIEGLTINTDVENDSWSQGSIDSSGNNENNNRTARNDNYIVSYNSTIKISLKEGYSSYLYQYDENKKFIKRSEKLENGSETKTIKGYIRLIVFSSDFSEISIPNEYKKYITAKFIIPIINEIDKRVSFLEYGDISNKTVLNLGEFEQGGIDGNGNNEIFNRCARTINKIEVNHCRLFININNYSCRLWMYDTNDHFMGASKILSNSDEIVVNKGTIRVTIFSSDFSEIINPNTIKNTIKIYEHTKGIRNVEDTFYSKTNNLVSSEIKNNLLTGTTISDIKHKVAIVSDVKTDKNGNLYVGCYVSDKSAHEGKSPYAVLNTFNILYPSKAVETVAFKVGDIINNNGKLIDSAHNLAIAKYSDNILRLLSVFKASGDNGWYLGYRDYDINNKTLTNITTCSFKIGETVTPLNTTNALQLAKSLSVKMDAVDSEELYFPQIVKSGEYFYTMGTFGSHSNIFMKSTNCETWEFVSEPPVDNPCGEFAIKTRGNNEIIAVNRSGGNYGEVYNLYLLKYNIANKTWSKVRLYKYSNGGAKPTVAIQNNYAYVIAWVDGSVTVNDIYLPRTYKTMFKINLNNMTLEKRIGVRPDVPLCDVFLAEVGTAIYALPSTDKRGFILNENSDGRSEISINYFDTALFDLIN